MATSANVALTGGTAALVATGKGDASAPTEVDIYALSSNAACVYIGGDSGVTTGTGFPIAAGGSKKVTLIGAETVYAIAVADSNVRVFKAGAT